MFNKQKGKDNYINRINKTNFNSIVIPHFLQEPIMKTKPIHSYEINKKINRKWSKKNFMEEQLKYKKKYNISKTIKIITSSENIIQIKKKLKSLTNSNNNNNSNNNSDTDEQKLERNTHDIVLVSEPFHLTKGSITIMDVSENKTIPTSPTDMVALSEENTITISFTEPCSESEIINYLYSIDWGTFEAFSPIQNKSPVIIHNVENGVSYIISLKAENKYGISVSSKPISVFTGLLGFPNE
jgi:hypothetical protein